MAKLAVPAVTARSPLEMDFEQVRHGRDRLSPPRLFVSPSHVKDCGVVRVKFCKLAWVRLDLEAGRGSRARAAFERLAPVSTVETITPHYLAFAALPRKHNRYALVAPTANNISQEHQNGILA
jgi:hypothetical protein